MSVPPKAYINVDALIHNFSRVKKFAPKSKILCMLKANAYGHGLQRCAVALSQADGFGVARLDEAMQLRKSGVDQRILLMSGIMSTHDLMMASRYELDLVVHQMYQVELIKHARLPYPVTVWLKVDTGMHRLGFAPTAINTVRRVLQSSSNVCQPLHIMTHFACADEPSSSLTEEQMSQFAKVVDAGDIISQANSAAIVAWPQSHHQWVRPGIMLFGISPVKGQTAAQLDLKPVMTFTGRLIAINQVAPGERVGYSARWRAQRASKIGMVAVGYGDGYPCVPDGTPVLINGRACPLVGRVSMDMLAVDLTDHHDACVDDPVVLWGDGLPVEQIALAAGTISYDLLCGVANRVEAVSVTRRAHSMA